MIVEPVSNYILQLDSTECTYITESNRFEIKDGSILNLVYSPAKQIEMSYEMLKNDNLELNEQKKIYVQLARNCRDRYFANEFMKNNGLDFLIKLIKECAQENNEIAINPCLETFIEIIEHGLIDWNSIEIGFIRKIVHFINCGTMQFNKLTLLNSLIILENIFIMCPNHNKLIESSITLPNLINHIQNSDDKLDSSIHQNCISLINTIFSRTDLLNKRSIAKTICSKQYRTIILNNIIKDCKIRSEMSHQLYLLQTNILSLHEERLKFTNEQDINEKIERVCKIAFENDLNYLKEFNSKYRIKANSDSQSNFSADDYAKIGFVNYSNPIDDFKKPPGVLSLDLIIYFAQNYTDSFVKIVLENCSRSDKEHECPFIRSAIEITRFLVHLLKINEPANDEGRKFFIFFFTHDYPLEELFCICVPLLNKTWKEMRATLQDFDKVFSVFKQQLIEAFKNDDLASFDVLKKRLSNLSYNEIINIWQKEKISKKEWENNTQSISELKQIIKPELVGLIKQQRIQFLTEGTKFVKYIAKGHRLKEKFWFCRLSNKSKIFFYGDCDEEKIPSIEHLPKKLPVLDIKCILTGRDCPHMKDNRSKKTTFELAFSLVPESDTNEVLNFVAPDEKTFDYWIDGLNALLGKEMQSKETEHDLDLLLSLEMKLKLLETEGFGIPDLPPAIPNPPSNYNFD